MKLLTTIAQVRQQVQAWKAAGETIGLVPTMGFLHEGHASLIDASHKQNTRTVVSVFVNPMQFGENEDFDSYPRDLEHDAALAEAHGADVIFHPQPEELYPAGFCSHVDVDILTQELCGLSRPVHFRGVCTVVLKLFQIVTPDRAYFGKKDAQQLAVIRRMVEDLNINLTVVGCPIVREADGLAKSSRNTYLSPEERTAALVLSQAISLGKQLTAQGETDCSVILSQMKALIEREPLAKIDYVKIVDAATMQQIPVLDRPALCAMAVFIGKTRLIDNFFTDEVRNV